MSSPDDSSSSSSSRVYRGLINRVEDQVVESIDGFLLSNPHCRKLDGGRDIKVVIRADWDRSTTKQVALLSGGGDGHAPSHAGYVGRGMLTCAVSGEVFASPSVQAVLAGIRAIGRPNTSEQSTPAPGVLLIVKSYTGDRLNFGIALSRGMHDNIPVEMVIVGDDVTLPRSKGVTGRRGLAGTVLVHKIAGYAASQGLTLKEVTARAEEVARNIVTIGVATAACNVPGAEVQEARLPQGKMEIGMGIHNEAGASQLPLESSSSVVDRLLNELLHTDPDKDYFYRHDSNDVVRTLSSEKNEDIVLMVNNLGASTATEMNLAVKDALSGLKKRGLNVRRLLVGPFMTALDMKGFSLTLWRLSEEPSMKQWQLDAIDQEVGASGWPKSACIIAEPCAQEAIPVPSGPSASSDVATGSAAHQTDALTTSLLKAISATLLTNAPRLNALDAKSGDGDCGSTLSIGARVLNDLHQLPPSNDVRSLLGAIGRTVGESMGGSSGAVVQILFTGGAASQQVASSATTAQAIGRALQAGCDAVTKFGGARQGDRTMLDALVPAVAAFLAALDNGASSLDALRAGALAARAGCQTTKNMQSRAGRANYVSGEALSEVDPGAEAVALIWETAAEWANDNIKP